jgi:hypothetical protein
VSALDRVPDVDATSSLERWSYATMRVGSLLVCSIWAVDRAFRGDERVMLRVASASWASFGGRACRVGSSSQDAPCPRTRRCTIKPVAAGGSDLDEVVRGLAAITRNAAPFIVVAGTPLAGPNTRSLGFFAADHRFTPFARIYVERTIAAVKLPSLLRALGKGGKGARSPIDVCVAQSSERA